MIAMHHVLKTNANDHINANARPSLRSVGIIILWAIVVFAALWPSFQTMSNIWMNSSAYHQGMLVLPISLLLIARIRNVPDPISVDQSVFGLSGVFAFCLLWMIGRYFSANILEHISLVGILISGIVAMFGVDQSKHWAFPLGFLFFMVPTGAVLLPYLQLITAEIVAFVLNVTGIDTIRNGTVLSTSAARFDIDTGCAGLNFIIASLMVSALVSHLAFHTTRKMIGYVVFAIFISIAVNWLRAYLIISIATLSDMKIGIAENHVMLGWFLYCIVIVGLIWIAKKFSDPIPRDASTVFDKPHRFVPPHVTLFAMAGALIISIVVDRLIIASHTSDPLHASESSVINLLPSLAVSEQ